MTTHHSNLHLLTVTCDQSAFNKKQKTKIDSIQIHSIATIIIMNFGIGMIAGTIGIVVIVTDGAAVVAD